MPLRSGFWLCRLLVNDLGIWAYSWVDWYLVFVYVFGWPGSSSTCASNFEVDGDLIRMCSCELRFTQD